MYPLQSGDLKYFKWKEPNPNDALLLAAAIGILAIIFIFLNILKTKAKIPALNGTQTATPRRPRKFSVLALRRIANNFDLDREQTKMLEFVLRSDGVTDITRSLSSPSLIDRHFKKAYRLIEKTSASEDELNNRLSVLFATRNKIESNEGAITITSTRQIAENTSAVLTVGKLNYPIRVISSLGDSLVIENPAGSNGEPLQLSRGNKVTLALNTKTSKGFTVDSRVIGSADTAEGPVLQLIHSGQIKKLSNRQFKRRQAVIATAFYLVHTENTGRKKGGNLVVDKRRFTGNIMDISIGGCSIKTTAPINSGQRMKIEFTRQDNSIVAALGEVLKINRAENSTIMHIRFLKVPRKSLNKINAMVYEYAD
jgi:hypothetical protein